MSNPASFEKAIKQLAILLGLLIFAPIILSLGFKALNLYTKSPQVYIAYILVGVGSFLLVYAVYFGFKTCKTFLDTLFKK